MHYAAPAVLFDSNTQTVTYVSQPRVVEVVAPGFNNSAAPFPGIVFLAPAPVALHAVLALAVHAVQHKWSSMWHQHLRLRASNNPWTHPCRTFRTFLGPHGRSERRRAGFTSSSRRLKGSSSCSNCRSQHQGRRELRNASSDELAAPATVVTFAPDALQLPCVPAKPGVLTAHYKILLAGTAVRFVHAPKCPHRLFPAPSS